MKKTVLIFAMVAIFVFSAFGAFAANYSPTEGTDGKYSYTITCNVKALVDAGDKAELKAEYKPGESMYGLVAVVGGEKTVLSPTDSYVYIDQDTVDKDGNVTFGPFLPMGPSPDVYLEVGETADPDVDYFEECTLFIGGDGLGTATAIGVLTDASGVNITGNIVDTFAPAKVATVTVLEGDDLDNATEIASATTEADGTFAVKVKKGENYFVSFKKDAYLTLTYTGVNAAADVDLDNVDISELAGDVVESGTINGEDLTTLIKDFNSPTPENPNSDINGSGAVNGEDLTTLLKWFNKTNVIKDDWQNN